MRLVVARCEVLYTGRLTATLAEAVRLLVFKADGSVLVHDDAGAYKPLKISCQVRCLAITLPGQAFHINHGWQLAPSADSAVGKWSFSLAVDGVTTPPSFIERRVGELAGYPVILNWGWFFNFPDGMTGTHTFTGVWSGPCADMVAGGFAAGPCDQKNAIVGTTPLSITVTFV